MGGHGTINLSARKASTYSPYRGFLQKAQEGMRDRTILCVVEAGTAALIRDHLIKVVRERDALSVQGAYAAMVHSVRNLGRPGVAAMAISAVDAALWDLKTGAYGRKQGLRLARCPPAAGSRPWPPGHRPPACPGCPAPA